MSRPTRKPEKGSLDQFFRSVYDSLAKKVLEEEAEAAPLEAKTGRVVSRKTSRGAGASDARKSVPRKKAPDSPDATPPSEPTIH